LWKGLRNCRKIILSEKVRTIVTNFCEKGYWYHKNARVYDWQDICYVWRKCSSIDSRHSYIGIKCVPFLINLMFLYSYEAGNFMHGFLNNNEKKLARSFIINVSLYKLCLSTNRFQVWWLYVDRIYQIEFEKRTLRVLLGLLYIEKRNLSS